MAMCTAKANGDRGICQRPVPEGVLTQTCDVHLLLALRDISERGGQASAVARIRAAGK